MNFSAQIKEMLKSKDKKAKNAYLNNLIESAIIIFKSCEKEDLIAAIQALVDAQEEDKELLEKYLILIHKALVPNTGLGEYINPKNIFKTAQKIKNPIIEDIINQLK